MHACMMLTLSRACYCQQALLADLWKKIKPWTVRNTLYVNVFKRLFQLAEWYVPFVLQLVLYSRKLTMRPILSACLLVSWISIRDTCFNFFPFFFCARCCHHWYIYHAACMHSAMHGLSDWRGDAVQNRPYCWYGSGIKGMYDSS